MKLKALLRHRDHEKFRGSLQKFQGPIFGSIALMLKIYSGSSSDAAAAAANRPADDKILIADTVNKAFQTLKIVFARRVPLPQDVDGLQPQSESSKSSRWYPSCISRYLQDCQQRVNRDSLCKAMTSTTSEPRMFVACRRKESRVEYSQQDLVEIASVLMKLKKYLKQHCHQRQRTIAGKAAKCCCDKAVQCDYPPPRFLSSSRYDGKPQQPRRNSSSSLEYVAANYGGGGKSFRSHSSSAIVAQQRGKFNYSRSPRRSRLKRGLEILKRRIDDDDEDEDKRLSALHYNEKFRSTDSTSPQNRSDVLAVRKILLDDYITEVKEIIRAELSDSSESQILDSVRKRMDEDVQLISSSSCRSLSRCTSYATARECSSSCCCCYFCDCKNSEACESSCPRCEPAGSRERFRNRITNEDDKGGAGSTSAISSQSVDSGVQLDFPRSSSGCISSCRSLKTTGGSETSINDEMLCRRVESAVRKFTEKLIVCERRARDRSSDYVDGQAAAAAANPRLKGCTSLTDQRVVYESRLGVCGWSEDESITGISTPSLVSLSDEETPTKRL